MSSAKLRQLRIRSGVSGPDFRQSGPEKNSAFVPCGQTALALATVRAGCHLGRPRTARPKKVLFPARLVQDWSPLGSC